MPDIDESKIKALAEKEGLNFDRLKEAYRKRGYNIVPSANSNVDIGEITIGGPPEDSPKPATKKTIPRSELETGLEDINRDRKVQVEIEDTNPGVPTGVAEQDVPEYIDESVPIPVPKPKKKTVTIEEIQTAAPIIGSSIDGLIFNFQLKGYDVIGKDGQVLPKLDIGIAEALGLAIDDVEAYRENRNPALGTANPIGVLIDSTKETFGDEKPKPGDDIPGVVPTDEYANSENVLTFSTPGTDLATAEEIAARTPVSPKVKREADKTQKLKGLEGAIQRREEITEQGLERRSELLGNRAEILDKQAKDYQEASERIRAAQAERAEETKRLQKELQDLNKQIEKLQQPKYRKLSTKQIIGIAMVSVGRNMQKVGGPNPLLQIIDRNIQLDMQRQKQELALAKTRGLNIKNELALVNNQFGNTVDTEKLALSLTQQQYANELDKYAEQINDVDVATKLRVGSQDLRVQAEANKEQALLQNRLLLHRAEASAAAGAQGNIAKQQQKLASKESAIKTIARVLPGVTLVDQNRFLSISDKDFEERYNAITTNARALDIIQELQRFVQNHSRIGRAATFPWEEAYSRIQSLRNQLLISQAKGAKMGTLDAGLQSIMEGIQGRDLTGLSTIWNDVAGALQANKEGIQSNLNGDLNYLGLGYGGNKRERLDIKPGAN